MVSSSRSFEKSYPRSAISKKRVSSATFFSELPKIYVLILNIAQKNKKITFFRVSTAPGVDLFAFPRLGGILILSKHRGTAMKRIITLSSVTPHRGR